MASLILVGLIAAFVLIAVGLLAGHLTWDRTVTLLIVLVLVATLAVWLLGRKALTLP